MRFRSWTGAIALMLAANLAFAQGSAWTLLEEALKQFRAGKLTRAEQLFEAAVRKDARCQDAYYYLGVIAEKQKMPRKAIEYYKKIEAETPTYSLAAERMGHLALADGQKEVALKFFKVHAKERPSGRAHMQVATVELDLKQYKEAEATLQEAGKIMRGNLDLIEMQGRLYMETERYPEALGAYTEIVKKIPIDNTARYLRGVCLQHLERIDEADREFRQILERDPFHKMTLRTLIRMYEKDSSKKGDVAEYRKRLKALAKSPPKVRRVAGSRPANGQEKDKK